MSRTSFRQADVVRAVKSARGADGKVESIEITTARAPP